MRAVQEYARRPAGPLAEISDIADAIRCVEGASFAAGEVLHADDGQSAGDIPGGRGWPHRGEVEGGIAGALAITAGGEYVFRHRPSKMAAIG
jgi:hypothetical protein